MSAVPHVGRAGTDVSARTTHQLYERYGRQIYAYCLHRLRSKEEAEDAVQTTFLNAFRSLQRGATTQFEQAWLYKIAQNVCFERAQSSGKRAQLETASDLHQLQEIAPAHAHDAEQLIGIEDALAAMPENQRTVILLREWQGLSYREIAARLGLSQASVEMLIFRARRSLAAALEQPGLKKARAGGRALNIGTLVTALKTLFSGGAAMKAVAVAVAAGTVAVAGTDPTVRRVLHRPATPKAVAPALHAVPAPARASRVPSPSVRTAAVSAPVVTRRPVHAAHRRAAPHRVPVVHRPAPTEEPAVTTQTVAPAPEPAPAPAGPRETPPAVSESTPSAAPAAPHSADPHGDANGHGQGGGKVAPAPPVQPDPEPEPQPQPQDHGHDGAAGPPAPQPDPEPQAGDEHGNAGGNGHGNGPPEGHGR